MFINIKEAEKIKMIMLESRISNYAYLPNVC